MVELLRVVLVKVFLEIGEVVADGLFGQLLLEEVLEGGLVFEKGLRGLAGFVEGEDRGVYYCVGAGEGAWVALTELHQLTRFYREEVGAQDHLSETLVVHPCVYGEVILCNTARFLAESMFTRLASSLM